jgi:hypothetical protein
MKTDKFLRKKSETEGQQNSSATLQPKEVFFTARQFQKSPLRPPFIRGVGGISEVSLQVSSKDEHRFTLAKDPKIKDLMGRG